MHNCSWRVPTFGFDHHSIAMLYAQDHKLDHTFAVSTLIFFYQLNKTDKFLRFLGKLSTGACMQTLLVLNDYLITKHNKSTVLCALGGVDQIA